VAILITDECIACGACEDQCPNTAISLGDTIFVIDPGCCTECVGFDAEQACIAACPVDCCVPDTAHVEAEEDLFARAQRLHPDQVPPLRLSPLTSHFRAG